MTATPDETLLQWLNQLTKGLAEVLVKRYIFMTSAMSSDFAMSDEEALLHFRNRIMESDFPLRRVAKLLTVRSIFSFLLQQPELEIEWKTEKGNLRYIETARYTKNHEQWVRLCLDELSDQALSEWLQELQQQPSS